MSCRSVNFIQRGGTGKSHLTKDLIVATLEKIIRQNNPFYTQVWNNLTSIQKRALIAVITQSGMSLQSNRVARNTGVSASSMRKSLESLVARNILRQAKANAAIYFRSEDPFFARRSRLFNRPQW